jgi:hypothetical protein
MMDMISRALTIVHYYLVLTATAPQRRFSTRLEDFELGD